MRQCTAAIAALMLASERHPGAIHRPKPARSRRRSGQAFIAAATEARHGRVELGKLAAEKARMPRCAQFGQHMVDDHTKAGDQLLAVMQRQNPAVARRRVNAEHVALKGRLQNANPQDFDRLYLSEQVRTTSRRSTCQARGRGGSYAELERFAARRSADAAPAFEAAQQVAAKPCRRRSAPRATAGPAPGPRARTCSRPYALP